MLLEPHQRYFLTQMEQLDSASVKVTGRRPSLTRRRRRGEEGEGRPGFVAVTYLLLAVAYLLTQFST